MSKINEKNINISKITERQEDTYIALTERQTKNK